MRTIQELLNVVVGSGAFSPDTKTTIFSAAFHCALGKYAKPETVLITQQEYEFIKISVELWLSTCSKICAYPRYALQYSGLEYDLYAEAKIYRDWENRPKLK